MTCDNNEVMVGMCASGRKRLLRTAVTGMPVTMLNVAITKQRMKNGLPRTCPVLPYRFNTQSIASKRVRVATVAGDMASTKNMLNVKMVKS